MRLSFFGFCLALVCGSALAQPSLDAAAIRRKAAQIAELKVLLADPDAMVRLVTLQQAVASPDAGIRALAIQTGLASNETDLVNTALRGLLTGRSALVIRHEPGGDKRGRSAARTEPMGGDAAAGLRQSETLILTIGSFDTATGRLEGVSTCRGNGGAPWTGAITGATLTFLTTSNICLGRLEWNAEANEFKGSVNVSRLPNGANLAASWNPN